MQKTEFITFFKSSKTILSLILITFFLKGLLLSSSYPIFGGQDESRHYNTIQFLNEPKEKNWAMEKQDEKQDKDNISTYRYSDEIKNTSLATDTDVLRGDIFNTITFSQNNTGFNENEINQRLWQPINRITPPDIVYGDQLYHKLGSSIEKAFSSQSILVRFYLIRILSVLFGAIIVLLSFLIANAVGFSNKHSLLLTAIISFQPKFSTYFTNINYDTLSILMFVLFTYAGVLILKKGLNWKNLALIVFSIVVGILTKKNALILLIPFVGLLISIFYYKFKSANQKIKYSFYAVSIVAFILTALFLSKNIPASATLSSVGEYLSKSLSIGRFALSSRTYWGTLDWTNNWFMGSITNLIWLIQAFAVFGLGIFFFPTSPAGGSKKPQFSFLPEKKYVIFLIGIIIALQLGIRTADWIIFSQTGGLDLGTPGRYFLPNLVSHIILVFTGLGMFFSHISNLRFNSKWKNLDSGSAVRNDNSEKWFDYSLLTGLILMISLTMYLIFDVIIYRFYL